METMALMRLLMSLVNTLSSSLVRKPKSVYSATSAVYMKLKKSCMFAAKFILSNKEISLYQVFVMYLKTNDEGLDLFLCRICGICLVRMPGSANQMQLTRESV